MMTRLGAAAAVSGMVTAPLRLNVPAVQRNESTTVRSAVPASAPPVRRTKSGGATVALNVAVPPVTTTLSTPRSVITARSGTTMPSKSTPTGRLSLTRPPSRRFGGGADTA